MSFSGGSYCGGGGGCGGASCGGGASFGGGNGRTGATLLDPQPDAAFDAANTGRIGANPMLFVLSIACEGGGDTIDGAHSFQCSC